MSLTRVTITGADDDVAPADLLSLSNEFPFVEWGVLFSPKRWGTPRYPSRAWVASLGELGEGESADDLELSAHLCGGFSREMQRGIHTFAHFLPGSFSRCQVNGICGDDRGAGLITAAGFLRPERAYLEIILQAKNEEAVQDLSHLAAAMPNASLLFDPSGGRGIEPFSWPVPPLGARMGYAGGIGPDNLLDVLRAIGPVESPFWIDMESGVRTDDRFDLAKARAVLETAAPFVTGGRS